MRGHHRNLAPDRESFPRPGYLWLSVGQVLLAALFLGGCWSIWTATCGAWRSKPAAPPGRNGGGGCIARRVLFTGWLQRRQHWLLNRNPIGWLQRRTWSARLCTWGWMGVVVLVETALVACRAAATYQIRDAQLLLAGFVALGLAFSAADSFRVERETGALELLLVTPLKVRQIIVGRLFGVWGQYVLVFRLLTGVWWRLPGLGVALPRLAKRNGRRARPGVVPGDVALSFHFPARAGDRFEPVDGAKALRHLLDRDLDPGGCRPGVPAGQRVLRNLVFLAANGHGVGRTRLGRAVVDLPRHSAPNLLCLRRVPSSLPEFGPAPVCRRLRDSGHSGISANVAIMGV